MDKNTFIDTANALGKEKTPFFFLIDFEIKKPLLFLLNDTAKNGIFFNFRGFTNAQGHTTPSPSQHSEIRPKPIKKEHYKKAFDLVKEHLQKGNTYLLNLTFPTLLEGDISMEHIFHSAQAPYKLYKKNDFVSFSPEQFICTKNGSIFSFPMKGTIDANIKNAEELLLNNQKELYEHNTIVDLIRNDLAIVAQNIKVNRFRYIDRVQRPQGELLQVSSEISGTLPLNWQNNIGDMLMQLLPAGSICGAPKAKTCDIIRQAEETDRGYYTGIFGIFNGQELDSAVNIRYIEKTEKGFFYRSGGGITALSHCELEYQELLEKIYVPII